MPTEERLRDVIERYHCLENIVSHARRMALSDPSGKYLDIFSLPFVGKKVKNKGEVLDSYFSQLQQNLMNYCFLDLVSKFEDILFAKISNASGEIRKLVAKEYNPPQPFCKDGKAFVKTQTDIANLADARSLVANAISPELSRQFSEIIRHRNWLAHGGRIGKPSLMAIDEMRGALQEILERI